MSDNETPSFAELAADPEIAALLTFTPVPRKVDRHNGWKPDAQREFIAYLAWFGVPSTAAKTIDKNLSGITALYKLPHADSFRAAWDAAYALGQRRIRKPAAPPVAAPVPGVPPRATGRRADPDPAPVADEEEVDDERKWELIHSIGLKFMKKVAAEREARLNGEIVAADFYLRQITFIELALEMTSKAFGWNVEDVLSNLRRGDHHITAIVNSELTDWMDRARRLWWLQEGEPERPLYPDVRFLSPLRDRDGAYALAIDQGHTGAAATPARGYDAEQWAALSEGEQRAAWERQYSEDAAEQRDWEARARRDYEERRASDASP